MENVNDTRYSAFDAREAYVSYLRRQSQDARAAAEHDRRIRVIRNQPRNPKARKRRES